jgi:hypothetical protein
MSLNPCSCFKLSKSKSVTTDGQSVSMSWCRAHFVDVWPDIAFFSTVWVWNLLSCLWGALSDERPGLSFVSHSLVICLYVHFLLTFLCFTLFIIYTYIHTYYKLQVTVSHSVGQGIESTLGLVTRYYFLSEGCFLSRCFVSVGRPLWREVGSVIYPRSVVIYQYLHQAFALHVFYSSTIYIQYI